ncbi:hypothetical protein LJR029_006149 [Caballeronia sp. LjRoot29]
MLFLLGHRAPEDRVIDLPGALITHRPANAATQNAETFLRVLGSRA